MSTAELTSVQEYPLPSQKTIAMGVDRARAFVTHIVKNEKVKGDKKDIGVGILKELHSKVLFYYPGWAGQFRVDDDTRVGGVIPVEASKLKDKVYLFERWLGDQVSHMREDPEDLYGALRIAAAAHVITVAELHPFDDGNGRVARVLMNGILMSETREARFYNKFIVPVPLLRDRIDEEQIGRALVEGREPKLIPYLQALTDVDKTWTLNPFEVHIATKWIESMAGFLSDVRPAGGRTRYQKWHKSLSDADRKIIEKMEERSARLAQFIAENESGKYPRDPVPDYSRWR